MLSKEEKRKRILSFYRYVFLSITIFISLSLAIIIWIINLLIPGSIAADILVFILSMIIFGCLVFFLAFLSKDKEAERDIFKDYENVERD